MKCAVVGLGEFGSAAAIGMAQNGADVIAVDNEMDRINAVKDKVSFAVRFDATQEKALKQHGIGDVDLLVAAIGSNFEAQVLVVVHAKKLGVKRILARATTRDHFRVLEAVGADEVFNPEQEAARWMVQRLTIPNISKYFELAEGFSIIETTAPESLVGKTLEELDLRRKFRLNLVALQQRELDENGEPVLKKFNPVPAPKERIGEHDILALAGSVLDLAAFMGEHG